MSAFPPSPRCALAHAFLTVLAAGCFLTARPLCAQNTTANEGGDLAFGGGGSAPGKFLVLQDIAFDPHGVLYALDGVRMNNQKKELEGNLRVQKFDRMGQLLGAIDLKTAPEIEWSDKIQPQRIAADSAGNIYVTVPGAGKVLQWNGAGAFVRAVELPRAMAVTLVGHGPEERVAVVPSAREVVQGKGWTWLEGDKIVILSPSGGIERTIPLPQSYEDVQDVTADQAGDFFVKAEPNAIYEVSPSGKLLQTYGGNATTRNPDGSEVLHTVGVDSKGNVYSFAWGNPSLLTRFDADGRTVTQREGQFKWADPWGVHSSYTPLAIDPDDRVWVAATSLYDPSYVHFKTQRDVPAIVRTRADFFAPSNNVRQTPLRRLGFRPSVRSGLPLNVSYEPNAAVPMELTIAAANRHVSAVTARWRVFDALKNDVAQGAFELPLESGQAASHAFTWTPPRFGSYFVQVDMSSSDGEMEALGEHIGVTPHFPGMPELPVDSKGGWADAARQLWTGLPNMRIHPGFRAEDKPEERAKKMEALEEQIAAAEKAGATFLVQLVDNQKNFSAADASAIMERFKGRIKYVEVCNEPNFTGSVDDYFKIHQAAYAAVKAADPAVQVMGPATVNIDLGWLQRLYELGFKEVSDIVSVHDYEGHESIDPVHWRWKLAEARKIMAAHGDAAKPIWQTERAISGVRGNNFQGLVQAIRMCLHRDLLETLGIPSEHNNHYYLNQGGYSSVPTYVWSAEGPMPAALAVRTRHALTAALGRVYAGQLDFGPTGNTLYLGVRYAGPSGETVVLRNLGAPEGEVEFPVSGGDSLSVTDAWGNAASVPVEHGHVKLALGQLPIYVQPGKGVRIEAPRLDFGPDLAPRAELVYSSTSRSPMSLLNNGLVETYQAGDPSGDTNGAKIWQGDLPSPGQILEMRFPRPQTIDRAILRTPRADNAFTTLLDYDLQSWEGSAWKTIASVHRPMPPSEPAITADATDAIWMDDTNIFLHSFAPIVTEKLRLVVRRTTHGFVPDDRARAWSNLIPEKLMLREVELYGPALPVHLEATLGGEGGSRILEASMTNGGSARVRASLRAFLPAGWSIGDAPLISLGAGETKSLSLPVTLAPVLESGTAFLDLELRGEQGELLGSSFTPLITPAPVEIAPQMPKATETTAEGALLQVAVKNTSAAPVSGLAAARLSGPAEKAPLELAFGPLAAGQSTTLSWRVPGLDLAKEHWSVSYEIVAGGVRLGARKELFGQSWSIVGPFPRDFNAPDGPEKTMKLDVAEVFTDRTGNGLRWQVALPKGDGLVNLGEAIKPNNEVMAYAVTVVTSPQARKALFSVGTDDGGKGWLNGQVVYSDDGSHGASPGQQQIPVELKAGLNEVWLKVTQGSGAWGFYFDLLDPQSGKPLSDLTYSAHP